MLIIDLHTHINLLPNPLPTLLKIFCKQNLSLQSYVEISKKHQKKIILSPVIYNVLGIHQGISGVKHQLKKLSKQIQATDGRIKILTSKSDLDSDFDVGLVLQLESCRWIKEDKIQSTLEQLYELGIRGVIPIHFIDNWLGHSCNYPYVPTNSSNDKGLQVKQAEQFFEHCKKLRLWIDLSHMSTNAIDATFNFNHHSICMTHTSIKDINNTNRAISRQHIEKIVSLNGFIGLSPTDRFVSSTDQFIKMITYFNEIGINSNYGFGSDYGAPIKTDSGLENYKNLLATLTHSDLNQKQQNEFFYKGALEFLKNSL